jgi:hypothetical protein
MVTDNLTPWFVAAGVIVAAGWGLLMGVAWLGWFWQRKDEWYGHR